uniref:Uncharacterized protein n=1 Tax=Anopheles christyi TaxID=43041 RepID=A0A182K2V8_9DIPT
MSTVPPVVDTTDSSAICGGVTAAAFAVQNATVDEEEVYRKLFGSEPLEDVGVQSRKGFLNSTPSREYPGGVRPGSRTAGGNDSVSSSCSLIGASDDDYKGGLLATTMDDAEPASISSRPSDSSRGFQNTFTVLERHLQSKHFQFRQLRRFLQYNESNQTPVFCNVPPSLNDSSNYLRSISEESGTTSTVTSVATEGQVEDPARRSSGSRARALFHSSSSVEESEHEPPSLLELELEASDRLRRLRERLGGSVPDLQRSCESIETPLVKALYGVSLESLAKSSTERVHPDPSVFIEEDDKRSLSGEYPDYPYYVARGSNGLPYLKVVHNSAGPTGGEKGE